MKSALVAGANGYLGRHAAQALLDQGYKVVGAATQETSRDELEHYIQVDFSDPDQVAAINLNYDFIFFFVGRTGTSDGFDNYQEYIRSNDVALLNLLNQHRLKNSSARIVFPSSRLVYEGKKEILLKEDDPKTSKTIYAQNKNSCEGYLAMYANRFGTSYTIFRICVPYGNNFDDSYSYGTIGFFLSKAQAGEDIPLFGDGALNRTFTHVDDICSSMLMALQNDESNCSTYNIGSNDNCSLLAAATLVGKKFGVNTCFVDWPEEARLLESGDTIFDDTRIKQQGAIQYRYSLEKWIKSL